MLTAHDPPLPEGSCQPQDPEEQGKDEHNTREDVETKCVYSNFNGFITITETLFCVLYVFFFFFNS